MSIQPSMCYNLMSCPYYIPYNIWLHHIFWLTAIDKDIQGVVVSEFRYRCPNFGTYTLLIFHYIHLFSLFSFVVTYTIF